LWQREVEPLARTVFQRMANKKSADRLYGVALDVTELEVWMRQRNINAIRAPPLKKLPDLTPKTPARTRPPPVAIYYVLGGPSSPNRSPTLSHSLPVLPVSVLPRSPPPPDPSRYPLTHDAAPPTLLPSLSPKTLPPLSPKTTKSDRRRAQEKERRRLRHKFESWRHEESLKGATWLSLRPCVPFTPPSIPAVL